MTITFLKNEIELNHPLAFGTLQWGTTWVDDKLINANGVIPDEECSEILRLLIRRGIQLIDTAEGYGGGTSEKRLGRLIEKYIGYGSSSTSSMDSKKNFVPEGKHAGFILMTKFLPVPWRGFHSDFERAVTGSCKRLGVDSIPIYLLHSPVHWRPIEYWIEAGAICKSKGLLQTMGLSNCNADQVRRAVAAGRRYGIPIVCNQVHFSLLDYNSQSLQEMWKVCRELGVIVVGFSPLGQGLLTESLTDEKFRANKPAKMLRLCREDLESLREVIRTLAAKYNTTMSQVSLNWCIRKGVVPLVGCRSRSQAQDSLGCLNWELDEEDVHALDRVALDRSTLDSPSWRRAVFVTLFGIVNLVCGFLDRIGLGDVTGNQEKKTE